MEEAEQRLTELEKKIAAVAEAKQKLAAHQKRVADFEAANKSVLAPSASDEGNSAAGQLRKQLAALKDSIAAVLVKYAVDADSEETWLTVSEQRLAKKREIEQKQKALAKQIEDFENANRDALTGKEQAPSGETSAQGKLEKQLEALLAAVNEILEKYQITEDEVDSWIVNSEHHATAQDDIQQRLAALEKQIAEFEATHKEHLASPGETVVISGGNASPIQLQLRDSVQLRETLIKERTQAEDAISHADETLESYRTIVSRLRILGEEKQKAQSLGIVSVDRIDGYEDFIFLNSSGHVQRQGNLNKALKRIMRDCNDQVLLEHDWKTDPVLLPDFSCHILRHTFATRLCESGINIKVIQDVLGHVDVATTMDIYVDVMNETKKRELASFDGYMERARAQ